MMNQSQMEEKPPPSSGDEPVAWFVSIMGYGADILYWGELLRGYLEYFPNSYFYDGGPCDRPIPGTDRCVEGLKWIHLNLGPRTATYDRKLMLVSPFSLARIRTLRPRAIVISEFALASIYVCAFRRLLGANRILLLVESDPIRGRPNRLGRLKMAIRRYVVKRADLILTNNDGGRRHLINDLGVPDNKILCQPYLVSEHQTGHVSSPNGSTTPKELQEDVDNTVFLYVGQLVERKGVAELVEAVARLEPGAREQCRFWLVGSGDREDAIKARIIELGLQSTIRMLGSQSYDQMYKFYQAADVFVMPTLDDYRALVGFEALCYGLPVLHSVYDGAISEIVDEGKNGFSVDPLDSVMFAERLERFVGPGINLKAMGQRSREMSTSYTLERGVKNLADAVRRCLDLPQPRQLAARDRDSASMS
jgi:glycosyltransferase involved in cell wall biosynthesis